MNSDVQLGGNVIYTTTMKFSCKGYQFLSIVNITFTNGKCYTQCQDGMCAANFKSKKNIDWRDEETECTHICSHLKTLFSNLEYFKSYFPDFFTSSDEEHPIKDSISKDQHKLNTDDTNIGRMKIHGGFNKEKGLWEYPSVTSHKTNNMMNLHLVNWTEQRNDYIHSTKIDQMTELYQTNKQILC